MIISVLLGLFSLSLAVFVFYVSDFDNSKRSDQRFNTIVKAFIALLLVHGLLIYLQIGIPIALLYGPVHLSLHRISKQKEENKYLLFHLFPFVIMAVLYCVLYYNILVQSAWVGTLMIYYPILFTSMVIITIVYGTYIWATQHGLNRKQQQLVIQLASMAFIISVFLFIFILIQVTDLNQEGVGFNPNYIVYGLMAMLIFFMISYLWAGRTNEIEDLVKSIKLENAKYHNLNIEEDALKAYALRLECVINGKKLYLRSDLSLDELQIETEIPKHHLSKLFNAYFGKTFYHYIAEKRIQEVISRIEGDGNITLESLAFECGFNSKTSFNKYFKEFTGVTPSEYRNKMIM